MTYTIEKIKNIIHGILPLYRIDDDGRWRPFFLVKLYQDLSSQELRNRFQEILFESAKKAPRYDIAERCYIAAWELDFDLSDYESIRFIQQEKQGLPSLMEGLQRTLSGVEVDKKRYLNKLNATLRSAEYHKGNISKWDFKQLGVDIEVLWRDLIAQGYVNEKGQIQDKFRGLTDASEMQLRRRYVGKRDEIWNIMQQYQKVYPDTVEFLNELKSRVEKKMAEERQKS